MAFDSLAASAASQISQIVPQPRQTPEAQERGPDRDKDADNGARVQASSSSPTPPSYRGQLVDIKA
ncbi:MAG: hypothetical protein EPN26_06080 [Rhodospirillales bacterium]|nr:MAG: hypothetical protein EPN26_06080 [Rhodospirillales bacterium]